MLAAQPLGKARKAPLQARSKQTVALILDAASQVFSKLGEDAVTTGAVAERAGVSIGTIYQYFSNRDSILIALAEQERQKLARRLRAQISSIRTSGSQEPARELIRALISSFARRGGATRQWQLLAALKERQGIRPLQTEFAEVLADSWAKVSPAVNDTSDQARAHVLTHGIFGALQAAASGDQKLLKTREFEDALCLMVAALQPPNARKPE